jgi:hypothetical protein
MTDYAANIANLEAAIATGEKRVEVNGEMVIYQDITQMLEALAYFSGRQAALTQTSSPAPGVTLAKFGLG